MEEKRTAKISLGMGILIFIIIVLILAIVGILYYYNVVKEEDKTNDSKIETDKTNDSEIETNETVKLSFGTYVIEPGVSEFGGDEEVTLNEDNTFEIYTGFGNSISGTYSISRDKIECKATTFYGVYSPEQEIKAKIIFEIKDENSIQIIETSETYEIETYDVVTGEPLGERKEMYLSPLDEGVTFNFVDESL